MWRKKMHYLSSNKILRHNFAFLIVYEYGDVERGQEYGIQVTDLNFEFKMKSSANIISIDRRIMDVASLIRAVASFESLVA